MPTVERPPVGKNKCSGCFSSRKKKSLSLKKSLKKHEPAEEKLLDMSRLFIGKKFACGAHSRLYHGMYDDAQVAVKVSQQPEHDKVISNMVETQFSYEVSILSQLPSAQLLQFVGACKKPPVFCVVTKFMHGGSVRDFLDKNEFQSIPTKVLLGMALDIARGMEYIHSQGVVHGDLKSDNLLLDDDKSLKITDFGTAHWDGDPIDKDAFAGTYRWMAPEMIASSKCSPKVDVYSFGIILWELLTGKLPFEGLTPVQVAYSVVNKNTRPEVPPSCPNALAELMQKCWNSNPSKRPSFSDAVKILENFPKST